MTGWNGRLVTGLAASGSAIVIALSGCAGDTDNEPKTQAETQGAKTYEGDGFTLSYPNDWVEVDYEEEPENVIAATAAFAPKEAGLADSLSLVVGDVEAVSDSTELVAAARAEAEASYDEVLSGPTPTTIGGLPAVRLEASETGRAGTKLSIITTIVANGATWYVLQCEFLPADRDLMESGCNQAMGSFRLE